MKGSQQPCPTIHSSLPFICLTGGTDLLLKAENSELKAALTRVDNLEEKIKLIEKLLVGKPQMDGLKTVSN